MSVSQAESFFVRGANTAIKMNGTISGDSATGQKKFMVRQWAALIEFCGVEIRKQVQKKWKQIEKARGATDFCVIVVTAIKEQQVGVDRQSSQLWFGNYVAEDICKCRFTYGPMENMAKTERDILIIVFIRWTAQKIWNMEEAGVEKQHINHITPEILKKFQKKQ